MSVKKFWLGNLDLTKKIHIYGGGISGLSAAYKFKKAGLDFVLYEKSSRLGGKIQSTQTKHGLVEWAANAIVNSPEIEKILTELEISPLYVPKGLKRCIYRDGKIQSFPPFGFKEGFFLFKNLFNSFPGNLEDSTLKEAFYALLGENLSNEVLSPIFRGVYATGAENLNVGLVLNGIEDYSEKPYYQFFRDKIKQKQKIQSLSFMGGMQELVDALEKKIEGHYELNANQPVKENALICTPPSQSAELIEKVNSELSDKLKKLKSLPIRSTTFFFEKEVPELKGSFGLLFNEGDSPNLMGILVNHEIFPQRAEKSFSYTLISKESVSLPAFFKDSPIKQYEFEQSNRLPLFDNNLKTLRLELDKASDFAFFSNFTGAISLRNIMGIV